MGVDIVDIRRRQTGALEGGFHRPRAAIAVGRRGGHMVSVAGHAITNDFTIDFSAALLGVLIFLEDHDTGPLAHDKAVAPLSHGREARSGVSLYPVDNARAAANGHPQPANRRFGAADHHHIGVVVLNNTGRVANRVGAGGAGRDHRVVGPANPYLIDTWPDAKLISAEGMKMD